MKNIVCKKLDEELYFFFYDHNKNKFTFFIFIQQQNLIIILSKILNFILINCFIGKKVIFYSFLNTFEEFLFLNVLFIHFFYFSSFFNFNILYMLTFCVLLVKFSSYLSSSFVFTFF